MKVNTSSLLNRPLPSAYLLNLRNNFGDSVNTVISCFVVVWARWKMKDETKAGKKEQEGKEKLGKALGSFFPTLE